MFRGALMLAASYEAPATTKEATTPLALDAEGHRDECGSTWVFLRTMACGYSLKIAGEAWPMLRRAYFVLEA